MPLGFASLDDLGPRQAARQFARRAYYEFLAHRDRYREPRRRPVVVVFPSSQPWDAASRLRAWEVAPELRALGWRVVLVPEPLDLAQRRRILALEAPDVVLLQQTRHPLNQAELYAPVPCVLDADDADYLDPRHHDRIVQCASACRAVIGGSRFVADCLGKHNGDATVIWTATPLPPARAARRPRDRAPVVTWAHGNPFSYPDEAKLVQEILLRVALRRPFGFWLFGAPEREAAGYLEPLRKAGIDACSFPLMDYPAYLARVAEAAVGLQPVCLENAFSHGKSFGKVLAYLAGEVAVVATRGVDHPLFFRHGENGLLVTDTAEWVDAIMLLLDDPEQRERMAEAAYEDFERRLTTRRFAERMDRVLRRAAGNSQSA
jgi:glycosyltransferase involved in cell wall biosynthesis